MAPVSTQAPTATPAAVAANVVILCVFFDGLVKTTEADEYVVVLNQGSAAAQLEGWQLIDQSDGAPQFVFPVYSLQPQATVRVYTNEVHWRVFLPTRNFNLELLQSRHRRPDQPQRRDRVHQRLPARLLASFAEGRTTGLYSPAVTA
jgi:hypothetical protein